MVAGIHEIARRDVIRGAPEDDSVFRAGGLIADVIGKDFGFVSTSGGNGEQSQGTKQSDCGC
jgi:hypothetical protein